MNQNELNSIWWSFPLDPVEVLAEWPISVSMSPLNYGGQQDGWSLGVSKYNEFILADPLMKLRTASCNPTTLVSVYAVPMVPAGNSITEGDICTLPVESTICVTPLLSGCTIGIKRDGSSMFHKQPNNGQSGVTLQRNLIQTYDKDFYLVGAIDYINATHCAVIGVYVSGWEFYMQKLQKTWEGFKVKGLSKIGIGLI